MTTEKMYNVMQWFCCKTELYQNKPKKKQLVGKEFWIIKVWIQSPATNVPNLWLCQYCILVHIMHIICILVVLLVRVKSEARHKSRTSFRKMPASCQLLCSTWSTATWWKLNIHPSGKQPPVLLTSKCSKWCAASKVLISALNRACEGPRVCDLYINYAH